MGRKTHKNLLEMADGDRSFNDAMERIRDLRVTLSKCAGVIAGLDEKRLNRNQVYWLKTIHGWADHLRTLANELPIIESLILKRVTEE